MRSARLFLAGFGLVVGLAACSDDTTIIVTEPDAQLDRDLDAVLARAGVGTVAPPAAETPALVELGRTLFFDKILSGNRDISCATCHHPTAATGDGLPVSIGSGGRGLAENRILGQGHLIPRNAPHVFNGNVEGVVSMFWDSRLAFDPATGVLQTPEPGLNGPAPRLADHVAPLNSALAAQAMFPVTSREEMRGQPGDNEIADAADNVQVWQRLMARLGAIPEYRALFLAAFPDANSFEELTFGHAARAIAAFEQTAWLALDTPLDRYLAGDRAAMRRDEKRGALVFFGDAGCGDCHHGPLLSDFGHHALAVPQLGPGKDAPGEDLGRALQTGDPRDAYAFRTPALRNVALTGPWMHSGAYTTLEGAVRHHLDCVDAAANYDPTQLPPLFRDTVDVDAGRIAARVAALDSDMTAPIELSDAQFDDLMAFLRALTDPASIHLTGNVPDGVPSGLPIED